MPLSAGDRLGPSEILALRTGGMDGFYKASGYAAGREVPSRPQGESANASSARREL